MSKIPLYVVASYVSDASPKRCTKKWDDHGKTPIKLIGIDVACCCEKNLMTFFIPMVSNLLLTKTQLIYNYPRYKISFWTLKLNKNFEKIETLHNYFLINNICICCYVILDWNIFSSLLTLLKETLSRHTVCTLMREHKLYHARTISLALVHFVLVSSAICVHN